MKSGGENSPRLVWHERLEDAIKKRDERAQSLMQERSRLNEAMAIATPTTRQRERTESIARAVQVKERLLESAQARCDEYQANVRTAEATWAGLESRKPQVARMPVPEKSPKSARRGRAKDRIKVDPTEREQVKIRIEVGRGNDLVTNERGEKRLRPGAPIIERETIAVSKNETESRFTISDPVKLMHSRGELEHQQYRAARLFAHDYDLLKRLGVRAPKIDVKVDGGGASGDVSEGVVMALDRMRQVRQRLHRDHLDVLQHVCGESWAIRDMAKSGMGRPEVLSERLKKGLDEAAEVYGFGEPKRSRGFAELKAVTR